MQSKIVLREQCAGEEAELTLVKFREDPTMVMIGRGTTQITIELNTQQLLQLMHFINVILETS